jgi:hypothetical protein
MTEAEEKAVANLEAVLAAIDQLVADHPAAKAILDKKVSSLVEKKIWGRKNFGE